MQFCMKYHVLLHHNMMRHDCIIIIITVTTIIFIITITSSCWLPNPQSPSTVNWGGSQRGTAPYLGQRITMDLKVSIAVHWGNQHGLGQFGIIINDPLNHHFIIFINIIGITIIIITIIILNKKRFSHWLQLIILTITTQAPFWWTKVFSMKW